MKKVIFLLVVLCVGVNADALVWNGYVSAKGVVKGPIPLKLGETYYFKVGSNVHFGKWWKNGRSLKNDACYEFNAKGYPDPLPVFENNLRIPLCSGTYHANHSYTSALFTANNSSISFRIFDTEYSDNSGSMYVQLYRK